MASALSELPNGTSLPFLIKMVEDDSNQRYLAQLERLERDNQRLQLELDAEKHSKEEYRRVNERMWVLMRCGQSSLQYK